MEKFKPKIIAHTSIYSPANQIPVWGITLPKEKFLEFFKEEKGGWPNSDLINSKDYLNALKSYGFYLPSEERKYANIPSSPDVKNCIIFPEGNFLDDEKLIGTRIFGEVYAPFSERKLGFEILDKNLSGEFDVKKLREIYDIRILSFNEARFSNNDINGVNSWFTVLIDYFEGKYHKLKSEEIQDTKGKYAQDIVDMLRRCEFSENNIA
ncbi:MAG: hypothetical protein ACOYT4_00835 [Nanoarchaeota archaeon]